MVFGVLNCLCFIASYMFTNSFVTIIFPFGVYFIAYVLSGFVGVNDALFTVVKLNRMQKPMIISVLIQIVLIIILGVYIGRVIYVNQSRMDVKEYAYEVGMNVNIMDLVIL